MGVVPVLHPVGLGPAVVVHWIAALEDHAIDARRATEHFAPGVVDPATIHMRLGFSLVLPVVEPTADRIRKCRGHVNEHIPFPVLAPRFKHEDRIRGVSAETVRQRAAGTAAANDHVCVLHPPSLRYQPNKCEVAREGV